MPQIQEIQKVFIFQHQSFMLMQVRATKNQTWLLYAHSTYYLQVEHLVLHQNKYFVVHIHVDVMFCLKDLCSEDGSVPS